MKIIDTLRFGSFVSFKLIHKGEKKKTKSQTQIQRTHRQLPEGNGVGGWVKQVRGTKGTRGMSTGWGMGVLDHYIVHLKRIQHCALTIPQLLKNGEKIKAQKKKSTAKENYQVTCLITRGKSFIIAFGNKDFHPQLDQQRSLFHRVLTSPFYFLSQ